MNIGMHSLFNTPIETGILFPKYQTNFYDEFENKNPEELFNSEKSDNINNGKIQENDLDSNIKNKKEMEKAKPSNLGLTSSNPFFFDSKNFSNKLFIINITFDYDVDVNIFQLNFERIKGNLELTLKKFNLNLSNVLFIVSFLESSLDQLTFEKLFNYSNNNFVKELSENYPLISPIYFSLCKYNENSKNCDFLLLHKSDLNLFSSQKIFFTSILPCIKEVNSEHIIIITVDSKTYIGDNSIEQMILDLSGNFEDSSNPFNNNIIAVQASYNNSIIDKESQTKDFFMGIKEFEEIENSSYNLCRNSFTNSGLKLDNRFFIMKVLLKELMHFEEYFIENTTLLDYSNIYLHNLNFAKFLIQKLNDRDNKPYEIITSENGEFCSIYKKFHHTDWIDDNSKLSSEYMIRGFNGLLNFYKLKYGLGNLYGIYDFFKAFLFFCFPGMITMVLFIIFSVGFNHFYPAYGFMALFPFIYVLTLLMSLMGDYKLMRIFFFIINSFVIFYYLFAKIVAIVALDKLNKNADLYHYKKGTFIGLFIYNALIAMIPYFLNYKKFINSSSIVNAIKFLIFYPTYSSLMPILGLNHIFSTRAIAMKANLVIIFLLTNFLFSMLVYAIHSTWNLSYLLALSIIGTILFSVKILIIVFNYFALKFKTTRQEEISMLQIQKYFSNQIVIVNNNIFEKGVKLNDKDNIKNEKNTYNKPKIQSRLGKIDLEDIENENLHHIVKKENVFVKNLEGHFNDDEKHVEIDDDEGYVYGNENNINENTNNKLEKNRIDDKISNNENYDDNDLHHDINEKNNYYNNDYYDDNVENHDYYNENNNNEENNRSNNNNKSYNHDEDYNDNNQVQNDQDNNDLEQNMNNSDYYNANNNVEHANNEDHEEDHSHYYHQNNKDNNLDKSVTSKGKNEKHNVGLEDVDFDLNI